MMNIILGLRAVFLLVSLLLCYSFFDLAFSYWRRTLRGHRPTMAVHRFGFAVWLSAAGATLANINHIFEALGWPVLRAGDIPTAIGLALMSLGYFMQGSSKIEATGGNVRRFLIYGGGGIVLVGIAFALVPTFI